MKVQINTGHGIISVRLLGELDHHNAEKIRNLIEDKINEKGIYHLIIDLSQLDFMDSSGIGLLMGRYKLVAPLGGSVSVIVGKGNIERIVKMSGLERFIGIFKTKDEAFEKVSGGNR